jgi:hypothetical protein
VTTAGSATGIVGEPALAAVANHRFTAATNKSCVAAIMAIICWMGGVGTMLLERLLECVRMPGSLAELD